MLRGAHAGGAPWIRQCLSKIELNVKLKFTQIKFYIKIKKKVFKASRNLVRSVKLDRKIWQIKNGKLTKALAVVFLLVVEKSIMTFSSLLFPGLISSYMLFLFKKPQCRSKYQSYWRRTTKCDGAFK